MVIKVWKIMCHWFGILSKFVFLKAVVYLFLYLITSGNPVYLQPT